MVVYFSGTGNSRYAAKRIARRLSDELVDAGEYIKAGKSADFTSGKPWVFVSPTHGWRIPRIFEAFIRAGVFSGDRRAYFVMTCGDEIGAAGEKLEILCKEKCFDYMGVLQVIMPENYVAMFPVPDRGEAAAILERAVPDMERAAALVAKGDHFPCISPGFSDKVKTRVANPFFYAFVVKAKKFYATDACISCGKCATLCPTNTITIKDGKPQWGEGCTHCMACICYCPKKAIEYGRASHGKPRYKCPEYTGE